METCETCKFFMLSDVPPLKGKSPEGVCLRYPPTVHLVMTQTIVGQNQPSAMSVHRIVQHNAPACGEYIKDHTKKVIIKEGK